jgi:uncharacterized phosphosugar-binding protein
VNLLGKGAAYLGEIRSLLDKIQTTQADSIAKAADMVVDAVSHGGAVHVMDTGHMLMHELFGRTGGLMMLRPVNINMDVQNPGPARAGKVKPKVYLDQVPGLPQFVLDRSDIFAGDVLIIGSVSGRNTLPVGLALLARAKGIRVIALTSVAYSATLQGEHPSGKRLFEVADVVLDNCGVLGDAALDIDGIDAKVGPTSGIAAAAIMWALEMEIMERMAQRGMKPSVWLSNHMPGAGEFNRRAREECDRRGY